MSRALDRLIAAHKQNRQNRWQVRLYSSELSELDTKLDEVFKKLANQLEEAQKKSPDLIQALDNNEKLAEMLTLKPEEYEEVEKDLLEGAHEGKNAYKYKILPRIYSNIKGIDSSPQLTRKLISYYLKNRRKERMSRLYGERKHYSERRLADHLIHELYMELGRTLYFATVDNANEVIKNKKVAIPILSGIRSLIDKLTDLAAKFIKKLSETKVARILSIILGGSASAITAVVYIMAGIIQTAFASYGFGTKFLAIVGLFVMSLGVGFIFYYIFRVILTNLAAFLLPKALLAYYKGYELMLKFTTAFSVLFKGIKLVDLLDIFGDFVKAAITGDDNSKEAVMNNIKSILDNINSNIELSEFFVLSQPALEKVKKALENGETLRLSLSIEVASFIHQELQGEFDVPSAITSDDIALSQGLEQLIAKGEGKRTLPIELLMLAAFTSPKLMITLSAGNAWAPITLRVWDFCKEYGQVDKDEVLEFLDTYMKAFAKKRYELSKYLKEKLEKEKA
jgi:type IV secretory pathway VirB2 component (pilin)